jgi:hypothetical protein
MPEILASVRDVNAYLEDRVVKADDVNTELIQISVARIVRGYLARVVPNTTMATWTDPEHTPEIVREISGMLIASQLFFDKTIMSAVDIDDRHYAQILYDRAMKLLTDVVSGVVELPIDDIVIEEAGFSELDFFPVDDTDRAFTMGMRL